MGLEHVFSGAHGHVADWPADHWHTGIARPHSSQAVCVSVWGTLAEHPRRDLILADLLEVAGLEVGTPAGARITCEAGADGSLSGLLNETGGNTTPTSVDALVRWPGAVVTVESKFTETSFGRCNQTKRRIDKPPGAAKERRIHLPAACNGTYGIGSDQKTHTRAPCRLQTWDGTRAPRLYWQLAWELFRPEVLEPDGRPCPFAGPSFQLMRNLALARAAAAPRSRRLGREQPPTVVHRQWGLLVVHVACHRSAARHLRELEQFKDLLLPDVRPRVAIVGYERIADVLREHRLDELASWLMKRIAPAQAG
jgi:hypothetical protein